MSLLSSCTAAFQLSVSRAGELHREAASDAALASFLSLCHRSRWHLSTNVLGRTQKKAFCSKRQRETWRAKVIAWGVEHPWRFIRFEMCFSASVRVCARARAPDSRTKAERQSEVRIKGREIVGGCECVRTLTRQGHSERRMWLEVACLSICLFVWAVYSTEPRRQAVELIMWSC